MKLSLCVTTYNRYQLTIDSIAKVIDDPRISDIVILDDCSTDGSGELLRKRFIDNPKITVLFQVVNKGMSQNKHDAIKHAKNEWAIIFDSDNVIDKTYLDAFETYITDNRGVPNLSAVDKEFIFCPSFAKPDFDYRAFAQGAPTHGIYNAKDAARCIIDSRFNCLLNTCNYIVNRDFYLATYKYNPEHIASDTIWHNYNHLKAGGKLTVVPGMQYFHRVHDDSGFKKNIEYNMEKSEQVRQLIKQL